jgi:hypothetical protein
MKKNRYSIIIAATFFIIVFGNMSLPTARAQTAVAPTGNGSTIPYQIDSLANLYWITQNSGSWGSSFVQTANIDASSDSSWNSGAGFTPIGNSATFFTGSYDGGGHSISGLFIYSTTDNSAGWGMFAGAKTATIKNLSLLNERVTVTASGSAVGGLLGSSMGSSIDSCSTTGVIYGGGDDAGGLVGSNNNDLGVTSGGHITRSYSSASVSGGTRTYVGGLVGENYDGVVTGSYGTGNVTDDSIAASVGGLVGFNTEGGSISNCYSTGNATGTGSNSEVGGFAGYNYSASTISNSYSTGTVTGNSDYGGFIGYVLGGSVDSCFWDVQTSGQTGNGGGAGNNSAGYSTTAMKTQSTFTNAGWDFSGTWAIDPGVNNGYPGFFWETGYVAKSPTAATDSSTSLTFSSATLNGSVAPYKDTTTVRFIYGTATGAYPDTVTASQSPIYGYGATSVSKPISGLTASTTYYYRVIAGSTLGSAEGSEISFTTLAAPSAPTATTDSVSSIAATTATAYGSTNPNGDTTTVRFVYGTVSGTYTDSVTATQSPLTGYSSSHVSANLSGLSPSQTYYLRVAALNGVGYARGTEISFTTAVLVPETAPSGSGTSGDPHIIASLSNLAWLQDANNDTAWGDYYKQTANINASLTSILNSGSGLSPIGTGTSFSGTYDGQGYVIDSLYVSRTGSNNQGLFGTISSSAVIDSLGLTNANVSGYDFVGVLVGLSSSGASISHCFTTGRVYATKGDCGGLIGENDGSVAASFSNCSVTGGNNFSMGGLVGYSPSGTISNCYSTGEVNVGCGGAGGLLGNNSGGTVSDCYSVSKVTATNTLGGLIGGQFSGSVSASFWNTDSTSAGAGSGSIGAAGETSSQMKSESTYKDSSWDFTSTWAISGSINNGYPYLAGVDHSLAVQGTDFAATADMNSVTLSWNTQSEVNDAGFNILRQQISSVGSRNSDWELIASYTTDNSLRGLGTSSTGRSYDFTDDHVTSGATYQYKIQSVSTNGTTKDLFTLSVTVDVPKTYALYQNYPNPFNPATIINYQLPMNSQVTLKVYDVLGREVATLVDRQQNAGDYEVTFNATRFASGVYFYRIAAVGNNGQKFVSIKKLVLMK